MTKEEVVSLIDIISESLRDNPSQFQPNVSVAAVQGPRGGCREYNVYIEGDMELNVNVAQEVASRAITPQMQAAIDSINAIAEQLRSPTPDRTTISTLVRKLQDYLLPPVLIALVEKLISAVLGIGTVG